MHGLRFLRRSSQNVTILVRQEGHMLIGYARTSTLDQKAGYEAQVRDLEAEG